MNHNLDKQNIFNFFKAESFIQEINNDELIIKETKKEAKLKEVKISSLNPHSKYWLLDTESNAFQLQGNKVENIILEQREDGVLNIVMIELKSARVRENEVLNKFKNSLSFVYILLHLLEGKSEQKINVFGILMAQKEMQWNQISNLNIFSSTAIRYTKRSFFTTEPQITLNYNDLIKNI